MYVYIVMCGCVHGVGVWCVCAQCVCLSCEVVELRRKGQPQPSSLHP